MPLQSLAVGVLEDADLTLLEEVLETVCPAEGDPEERKFRAKQLMRLFQAGATTREELLSRLETDI